jgi:hypothetical protein
VLVSRSAITWNYRLELAFGAFISLVLIILVIGYFKSKSAKR